ncbi:MAG: membrane integrity-associated transporter subunit PqiC [bacterium]|nr:membrane integrity-associated transporter subunit PqiC [bacterium]
MRHLLLGALLACGLAGCSILGPPISDPWHFYTLRAAAEPTSTSTRLAVGLGPVRLPTYLDRAEMATRVSNGQIDFSRSDRWAEPIGEGVARVLTLDLSAALGTEDVVAFPWPAASRIDWTVAVDIDVFERDTSGTFTVDARWRIRHGQTRELLRAGVKLLHEEPPTNDAEGSVEAANRALAALAQAIAADLVALGKPAPYAELRRREGPR